MELHGYFRYGNNNNSGTNQFDSRDYGLMIAHVETKINTMLAGDIETAGVFNKINKRKLFTRDDYSDSPISFEIEFLVSGDAPLSEDKQRAIQNRLFYQQGYQPLYVDGCDGETGVNTESYTASELGSAVFESGNEITVSTFLNCRFTSPEKIFGNDGVVGYKATLEADAPFAWQEDIAFAFTISNGGTTVIADTDLQEYIYPTVYFTTGNTGGDVTIVNQTDDPARLTEFKNLNANSSATMMPSIGRTNKYNYFSKKNFIRFLPGTNLITITGDVTSIWFRWNNRRYL